MSTFPGGERLEGDWVLDRTEEKRETERRVEEYWKRHRTEPPRRGPWLLIGAFADDLGIRPLPANTRAYLSPDMKAVSSDGGPLTAGVPAQVSARVWNLGAFKAIQTRVDFYWGNPATALTPNQLHHLGAAFVTVNPLSSMVVACPKVWTPTYINGGHECLIARASCPPFDPATSALIDPWSSRHVGQHNVWVVEPGAESRAFEIQAGNPLGQAADMEFTVRAFDVDLRGVGSLTPGDLAFAVHPGAMPWQVEYPEGGEAAQILRRLGEYVPRSARPPRYETVDIVAELTKVRPVHGELGQFDSEATYRVLEERRRLGPEPDIDASLRAHIGANELVGIRLEQPQAQPGRAIVTHVTQMYGGVVIGGYAAVTNHNYGRHY
ncbi:hypothetical protein [Nocardia fluminea]|uniref:hypothetical protein n=1 Tax=Nocardia fluminea TaxID=134984 RepID=UPI003D09CD4F